MLKTNTGSTGGKEVWAKKSRSTDGRTSGYASKTQLKSQSSKQCEKTTTAAKQKEQHFGPQGQGILCETEAFLSDSEAMGIMGTKGTRRTMPVMNAEGGRGTKWKPVGN